MYAPQSKRDIHIHNGERLNEAMKDRYNVTNATANRLHQSTLVINAIRPSDAGTHECSEVGAAQNNHSFESIVLGMNLHSSFRAYYMTFLISEP